MAQFVKAHISASDSTSGTTVAPTLASSVPAGNLLIVYVVADNLSSTTPTLTAISKPANETATWTILANSGSSSATAAAGVVGGMAGIVTTVDWPSGTAVTATLGATATARRLGHLAEFKDAKLTVTGTFATATTTNGTVTASTGTGVGIGDLLLSGTGFENNVAPTGTWTTIASSATTTTATATSEIAGLLQYKLATTAGAQSFTGTGTGDGTVIVGGLNSTPSRSVTFKPTDAVVATQVTDTTQWSHNNCRVVVPTSIWSDGYVEMNTYGVPDHIATIVAKTGTPVNDTTELVARLFILGSDFVYADAIDFGFLDVSQPATTIGSGGMVGATGFYGISVSVYTDQIYAVSNGVQGESTAIPSTVAGVGTWRYTTTSTGATTVQYKVYRDDVLMATLNGTKPPFSSGRIAFGSRVGAFSCTFRVYEGSGFNSARGAGLSAKPRVFRSSSAVIDNFNRADSYAPGSPQIGGPYTAYNGVWGISGNALYNVDSSEGAQLQFNAFADFDCTFTMSVVQNSEFVFRWVDSLNYWNIAQNGSSSYLYCVINGDTRSYMFIASMPAFASGMVIRILAVGDSIKIWQNNNLVVSVTNSTFATASIMAFKTSGNSTSRFDDLAVYPALSATSGSLTASLSATALPTVFAATYADVWDTFTRADSTTSPGSLESGGSYTVVGGTWGISNNALYESSNAGEGRITWPGFADFDFSATLSAYGSDAGLVFRSTDANNSWLYVAAGGQLRLYTRISGNYTQIQAVNATVAAGDKLRVVANGPDLKFYQNSTLVMSVTNTYNQSATIMGFRTSSDTTTRFTSFSVDKPDLTSSLTATALPTSVRIFNPPLISDTFTRANSTNVPGSLEVGGGTYTVVSGTWGISSNALYESSGVYDAWLSYPGFADFDATFTVSVFGNDFGVVFRGTDIYNIWFFQFSGGQFRLYKRIGGSYSGVQNVSATFTAGDKVRIVANGQELRFYQNNNLVMSVTDSYNQTATLMGYRAYGDAITRIDDVSIVKYPTQLTATATATIAPKATSVFFSDNFNRADSTSDPGYSQIGGPYTVATGTWGISNNALYTSTNGENHITFRGTSDFDATFTFASVGPDGSFLFRRSSFNDFLVVTAYTPNNELALWKNVGGSWTRLAWSSGVVVAGTVVRVVTVSSSIKVYRNGSLVIDFTDSTYVGQTTMGFRLVNDTTTRIDDLSVTGPLAALGLTATATAASTTPARASVVLITDDFNRADNASSAGSPQIGGPYTVASGTWGISGNALYASVANDSQLTFPASADFDCSFVWAAIGNDATFMFRRQDTDNYLMLANINGGLRLYRRIGGGFTEFLNTSAVSAGTTIRILALGSSILVYADNVLKLSATETNFQTQTTMGFRVGNGDTTTRYDNLSVSSVGVPLPLTAGLVGAITQFGGWGVSI